MKGDESEEDAGGRGGPRSLLPLRFYYYYRGRRREQIIENIFARRKTDDKILARVARKGVCKAASRSRERRRGCARGRGVWGGG